MFHNLHFKNVTSVISIVSQGSESNYVIPFTAPNPGQENEEKGMYSKFEGIVSTRVMSSIVSWAIRQRKGIASAEKKNKVMAIKVQTTFNITHTV